MNFILDRTVVLFIVATLVALIARRLRLPYTVGLVVAGIGLAYARVTTGAALTHDFIFDIILPPLLFEAAINIHWKELRRDALPIFILAIFGVIISALFVAWGMRYFLIWPWPSALVFGILIAATDPVAVIAMFKETKVEGRVRLLVESESLFNDGVAAVLFVLAVSWASMTNSQDVTVSEAGRELVLTVGGGILTGLACGTGALLLAWRTSDHLIEAALTTIVAYGSFLLAEHLHVSGVLATVAAGLVMGNPGMMQPKAEDNMLSKRGRAFVLDFWEFAAFLANSLVFLLIGLRVAEMPFAAFGLVPLVAAIMLVITGRALAVYPICMMFTRSRWAIPLREQHILWWGGLRGALALALVLSLPHFLLFRDEIIVATFGVVVFSVLVQGLTMPPVLKKLSVIK